MKLAAKANDAIYSTLGTDPDLSDLVRIYVDEMPDRVATLQQLFSSGDLEGLRWAAHQLKGAAGSYGFDQLTPLAAEVERCVRDDLSEETLRTKLQQLIVLCQRLRAGQPE